MRLLLQQPPAAGESPRFVQLLVQEDLLGGWSLLRESGHMGSRSQSKREQFPDRDSAIAAFENARDAQVRRGFRVMFAQGETQKAAE